MGNLLTNDVVANSDVIAEIHRSLDVVAASHETDCVAVRVVSATVTVAFISTTVNGSLARPLGGCLRRGDRHHGEKHAEIQILHDAKETGAKVNQPVQPLTQATDVR